MSYVDQYMLHKSEEREKLINQQKRKIREREVKSEPMSPEVAAKFEELQKRLTIKEQAKPNTFSISKALQSMDGYLETLPEASMKLSDSDLKFEIRKTQNSHPEAYEILMLEAERRKIERKKVKNRK